MTSVESLILKEKEKELSSKAELPRASSAYLKCGIPPHIHQDNIVASCQVKTYITEQQWGFIFERNKKYAPVLPAFNEIKMTRVVELDLILARDASRSFGFIEPSSTFYRSEITQNGFQQNLLTSDIFNPLLTQERFNQIQHARELWEYNRLLYTLRAFFNFFQQLEDLPNLGRRRSISLCTLSLLG